MCAPVTNMLTKFDLPKFYHTLLVIITIYSFLLEHISYDSRYVAISENQYCVYFSHVKLIYICTIYQTKAIQLKPVAEPIDLGQFSLC